MSGLKRAVLFMVRHHAPATSVEVADLAGAEVCHARVYMRKLAQRAVLETKNNIMFSPGSRAWEWILDEIPCAWAPRHRVSLREGETIVRILARVGMVSPMRDWDIMTGKERSDLRRMLTLDKQDACRVLSASLGLEAPRHG